MLKTKTFSKLFGWPLVAAIPFIFMPDSVYAKVGVASVVNGEPLSKPPSESERVLNIGNDMIANEVITTKANDKAHIVFLDGSTLTIGSNSVITIDKFVYDTESRTGALNLKATKGVFRYVGGAISKTAEVEIKTPSATIGIRGGIATVTVEPSGATSANFLFGGSLTITSQGVSRTTTAPGTQINVTTGLPPSVPTPIPPGSLQQIDRSLQGTASNNTNLPTTNTITAAFGRSTMSQSNSAMAPATARAAIPSTQQGQLSVGQSLARLTTPATGQQASAPQQSAGPQQGAGPVQGNGPLQGTGSQQASGPLQGNSPLQANGPLQSSGPLVSSGPLQNAGPLAATSPLQNGPVDTNMALNIPSTAPGGTMQTVPIQNAALIPMAVGAIAGDTVALQQLQNLLASPQGTSSTTLNTLVNAVSSTSPTTTASTSNTPTSSTSSFSTSTTTVLPPSIYNPTSSSNVSPN